MRQQLPVRSIPEWDALTVVAKVVERFYLEQRLRRLTLSSKQQAVAIAFLAASNPQDAAEVINRVEDMFVLLSPCPPGKECNVVSASYSSKGPIEGD